jgi:ankyrin repeat protein
MDAPDVHRERPVYVAALRGQVAMVALLARRGADLRGVDKAGISPLWLSIRSGRVRVALCLLRHGALPNPGPAALCLLVFALLGVIFALLLAVGMIHLRF